MLLSLLKHQMMIVSFFLTLVFPIFIPPLLAMDLECPSVVAQLVKEQKQLTPKQRKDLELGDTLLKASKNNKKNLTKALELFEKLAKEEIPSGMYNAGILLDRLAENSQNPIQQEEYKKKARQHYRNGAKKGHIVSQHSYATMLINGEGGEINIPKAIKYCEKSKDAGYKRAIDYYDETLKDLKITDDVELFFRATTPNIENKSTARTYLRTIENPKTGLKTDLNFLKQEAKWRYADMLMNGDGGEKKQGKALKYFELLANLGHQKAQIFLGNWFSQMKVFSHARQYFEKATAHGEIVDYDHGLLNLLPQRQGYNPQQFEKSVAHNDLENSKNKVYAQLERNCGIMRLFGLGGETDFSKAYKNFERAENLGDRPAKYNKAMMLLEEQYGVQNLKEAFKLFKELAYTGTPAHTDREETDEYIVIRDAQRNYALMNCTGIGTEINLLEAFNFFQSGACLGDAIAQYNCGQMLGGGIIPGKLDEAHEYIKMAADNGFGEAQMLWGCILYEGNEVPKDLRNAHKYFKMAADQGHPEAANNYAGMYFDRGGNVIQKNLKEARKYFEIAANKDVKEAQYILYRMLKDGKGGNKNLIKAEEYLLKATQHGYPPALIVLHEIKQKFEEKSNDMIKQTSQIPEEEEFVTIDFPFLKAETNTSDEEAFPAIKTTNQTSFLIESKISGKADTLNQFPQQSKGINTHDLNVKPENEPVEPELSQEFKEEPELSQELKEYAQQNKDMHAILKGKKQKALAKLTRQTFSIRKNSQQTLNDSEIIQSLNSFKVKDKTIEFVKAIFGQGTKRIHSFSNKNAKKAFANLGCTIINGKRENSTLLSFNLKNGQMKLEYEELVDEELKEKQPQEEKLNEEKNYKYHNPHRHGDNKLYEALRPYFKRFLNSIGVTPETLIKGREFKYPAPPLS